MIRLQNVLKMSSKRICDTSWRHFEDVLKTSWSRLENFLKTSWRCMDKTNILVLTKMSWRRLQDVFWRRMINNNIFVFIKLSWRRLLKTKTKDVFIKTNVCWDVCRLVFVIFPHSSIRVQQFLERLAFTFSQSQKLIYRRISKINCVN